MTCVSIAVPGFRTDSDPFAISVTTMTAVRRAAAAQAPARTSSERSARPLSNPMLLGPDRRRPWSPPAS